MPSYQLVNFTTVRERKGINSIIYPSMVIARLAKLQIIEVVRRIWVIYKALDTSDLLICGNISPMYMH